MPTYRIVIKRSKQLLYDAYEQLQDMGEAMDRAADRAEEYAEEYAPEGEGVIHLDIEVTEEETRARERWRMRYHR